MPQPLPELAFASAAALARWLARNAGSAPGLWIRFYKKGSGAPSVTYAEALDAALCHGWIDGQVKGKDAQSWIHRFTPRKPKGNWSKRNRDHVTRLSAEGRMRPQGLAAVEAAKADGRWDRAYDSPSTSQAHPDFLKQLAKDEKAKVFYATLSKANLYAIHYRLQTAKRPETLARRIELVLEMLQRRQTFH